MPLPEGGKIPWPPKNLEQAYNHMAMWSAWYGGNVEELSAIYGGQASHDSTGFFASQQGGWRARVARTLQRWFWGTHTPQGEQRAKLHAPLAGEIAAKSSKLLFAEPPAFVLPTAKKANGDDKSTSSTTQDRLDQLVDDSVHASLLESGEVCAGLGGVYLRVVWNKTLMDKPWLSSVHADAAVPEWQYGRLSAVTFWRVLVEDGDQVVRHLERHESGVILHAVYDGTREHLGAQVPLGAYPETAALVSDEAQQDGYTVAVPTGVPNRVTAVYVPNIRPNRLWRNNPAAAHLGRSDFHDIESFLDQIDETWSSWMRDIRLAKGRAFVPDVYLQSNGPGKGASFDAEREIYATLNMLPQQGGSSQLTLHQFAIRVEEHSRTIRELSATSVKGAGYSPETFGLGGERGGLKTATEVEADQRDSFLTRNHKMLYWRPALAEITETLLMVDAAQFGSGVTPERPDVEFPDGVAEDPEAVARTLQMLAAAEIISIRTGVEMLHPDWDKKRVEDEVELIKKERGIGQLEDPGTFRGAAGPPGTPPTEEEPEDEEQPPEPDDEE